MLLLAVLLGCASTAAAPGDDGSPGKYWVYIGTYANGKGTGIALLEMDGATGKLTSHGLAAESINPSFLAIHPTGKYLYAVNEVGEFGGEKAGAVSAFALDRASGKLTPLNQQSSKGAGPCHLIVDRTGKNVLVANYGGGSAAVLPIGDDGRLGAATAFVQHSGSGKNPRRQEGPHAHSINLDAANRYAVVADLGLDKVFVYRFDADKGTLTANQPPYVSLSPSSGPRHFAFHPDKRHAYVINEMLSTVTALDYDAERGVLKPLQTLSTIVLSARDGNSTAEVQVHPSGKFVYGSNRGYDSIAIFSVDPASGELTPVAHQSTQGKTPRNFGIDPTGSFLLAANQDSGTVVVFKIDQQTGRLTPTGDVAKVPSPVCVKFLPKND